jgi:hypothetical protein
MEATKWSSVMDRDYRARFFDTTLLQQDAKTKCVSICLGVEVDHAPTIEVRRR